MKKILVIDDEEPILRHFRDLLRLLQYEPITANNSDEGYDLAKDPDVTLIISDLCMPGTRSEIEHIEALRAARPDIPMVVISGYPTPNIMQRCEELGVSNFLTKPFELSFISSVLEELLPDDPDNEPEL
ncbi:response regulator [Kiritimatiellota bacterium B12222]|nr:response regulator [Kiritimatiellota bacterium B12222]